jgi:hypothetical protein
MNSVKLLHQLLSCFILRNNAAGPVGGIAVTLSFAYNWHVANERLSRFVIEPGAS